jgi:ribosomal protein S18 acetylase RimI-like enzyme
MPNASCTIRNLGASGDSDRYLAYAGPEISDVTERFERYLDSQHFRPEWLWVAERGDDVVARAAFWGRPDSIHPLALDHFDVNPEAADGVNVGADLLRSAYAGLPPIRTPDYHLFLPPRWRDHPEAAAVRRHLAAAELAGFTVAVERHRLEWTPDCPLPPRPSTLTFRSVGPTETELLVRLFTRITPGSLDAGTAQAAATVGEDQAARDYLADMDALDRTRSRWLIGQDAAGADVGVVIAADASGGGHVGFVGVPMEYRGRGYGLALLVEATHRFAVDGANLVRGDTDHANTPMVNVFRRAGWRVWAARIVMRR